MRRSAIQSMVGAVVLFAVTLPAQEKVEEPTINPVETNASIQFNFLSPGARSLGLGGAFVALANDATAAYTNPAGLTILTTPELSFEVRGFNFFHPFLDGGRFLGQNSPSFVGVDDHVGLRYGKAEGNTASLSFVSAVFAFERFAIAAYRRQAADFEIAFATDGAFFSPPNFSLDGATDDSAQRPKSLAVPNMFLAESGAPVVHLYPDTRANPIQTSLRFELIDLGVSGGFKVGERVSIGLGLSLYQAKLASRTDRFEFDTRLSGVEVIVDGTRLFLVDPVANAAQGAAYGPPLTEASKVRLAEEQNVDDTSLAVNLGFLWNIDDRWAVGATFRQGPEFPLISTTTVAAAPEILAEAARGAQDDVTSSFRVPDILGMGVVFRPANALAFSIDYDRVRYSKLAASFGVPTDSENLYVMKDGNEFHSGFEWILVPVVVRFGVWRSPDHSLRYTGTDPFERARFPGGDPEFHYAVGVGVIGGPRFSIDGAYDYSDSTKTASISMVFRF